MISGAAGGAIIGLSILILLFTRGPLCFLLGIANIPGFLLWKRASAQDGRPARRVAVAIGWLGQSLASLLVVVLLSFLSHLLLSRVQIVPLLKFGYWIILLYVCVAPAAATLRVTRESETVFNQPYYRVTLTLTLATTVAGFIALRVLQFP